MSKCPCGQPLEIKTVRNLSFNYEVEVITCPCGRTRELYETDFARAKFIQFTYKQMGVEIPRTCRSNVTSDEKFKMLADSL